MCIQGRCGFIFDYGIACLALAWCRKPLTNSVTRVTIKLQISVKPRRILRRGLIYDHNGYHRGFRDRREHLAQEDTRPFAFQTKGLKTAGKHHKLCSRMRLQPRGRGFESLLLCHVGASFISLAPTFLQKSERAHAAVSPFRIEPAALGFDSG